MHTQLEERVAHALPQERAAPRPQERVAHRAYVGEDRERRGRTREKASGACMPSRPPTHTSPPLGPRTRWGARLRSLATAHSEDPCTHAPTHASMQASRHKIWGRQGKGGMTSLAALAGIDQDTCRIRMHIMEESHGQGTGAGKRRRADCQALFVKRFLSSGKACKQGSGCARLRPRDRGEGWPGNGGMSACRHAGVQTCALPCSAALRLGMQRAWQGHHELSTLRNRLYQHLYPPRSACARVCLVRTQQLPAQHRASSAGPRPCLAKQPGARAVSTHAYMHISIHS